MGRLRINETQSSNTSNVGATNRRQIGFRILRAKLAATPDLRGQFVSAQGINLMLHRFTCRHRKEERIDQSTSPGAWLPLH